MKQFLLKHQERQAALAQRLARILGELALKWHAAWVHVWNWAHGRAQTSLGVGCAAPAHLLHLPQAHWAQVLWAIHPLD